MIAWNIYNSGDALRIINQFSFSFTDFAIANAYAGVENARMSAIGPKQTSAIAPHMSAFDPKRTSLGLPSDLFLSAGGSWYDPAF